MNMVSLHIIVYKFVLLFLFPILHHAYKPVIMMHGVGNDAG